MIKITTQLAKQKIAREFDPDLVPHTSSLVCIYLTPPREQDVTQSPLFMGSLTGVNSKILDRFPYQV